jgi:hypothetical protein
MILLENRNCQVLLTIPREQGVVRAPMATCRPLQVHFEGETGDLSKIAACF